MVLPGEERTSYNGEESRLTMFFSRISLPPANARVVAPTLSDDTYGLHKMVWSFMADSPDRKRDFLYRHEAQKFPCFYVVSTRTPFDSSGLWKIETKPYEPQIGEGDVFQFAVRVNPVVTRRGEDGRQNRHDVIMDAKTALRARLPDRAAWPETDTIVRDAAVAWLGRRAEESYGFTFEENRLGVDGYQTHVIRKGRQPEPVRFSSVDLAGTLSVRDMGLFRSALFDGIGHAKGFGCGLLMIRPADSPCYPN